jgi:hypothetical protein
MARETVPWSWQTGGPITVASDTRTVIIAFARRAVMRYCEPTKERVTALVISAIPDRRQSACQIVRAVGVLLGLADVVLLEEDSPRLYALLR